MIGIYLFYAYWLIGLIYGVWFVFRGATQRDANLNGAGKGVRFLLLPGAIALWPLLLYQSFRNPAPAFTDWKKRHIGSWVLMALILPVLYIAAIRAIPEELRQEGVVSAQQDVLPVVVRTAAQDGFVFALRRDDAGHFQLNIEVLEPLPYPAALVLLRPDGFTGMEQTVLLGRLGSRGTYVFPLEASQVADLNITVQEPLRQKTIAAITL